MIAHNIETHRVKTAREFVEALRASNPEWSGTASWRSNWYFRGQSNEHYNLRPTAHRNETILQSDIKDLDKWNTDYIQRVLSTICRKANLWKTKLASTDNGTGKSFDLTKEGMAFEEITSNLKNLTSALTRSKSENDIALKYAIELDSVGLQEFPSNINNFIDLDNEQQYAHHILSCFMAETVGSPNFWLGDTPNIRNYFWLSQHHSLSTRLLDWTENPLAAAYFAVESVGHDQIDDICVWAFNYEIYHEHWVQGPNKWICFVTPPHGGSDYMRAQKGSFAYFPHAERYFMEHGDWPSIDSVISSYPNKKDGQPICLKKLCLPASEASNLVRILKLEGMSRSMLMPAHDQVAASIKTEFRHLKIKLPS